MYRTHSPWTKEAQEHFEHYGFLYVESFYDVENEIAPIQNRIRQLFELVLEEKSNPNEAFDWLLARDRVNNRNAASVVYDAIKKVPEYVALASANKNTELAKHLLRSEFVGFAQRGFGVRMDHPHEDRLLTQLHQDYTSQLCSPHGIVIWSPLLHVSFDMGPVIIYPESHKLGILPIDVAGEGSYGLQLRDADSLRRNFKPIAPEVRPGDAVILHMLTLHESAPNRGTDTRWAMISRYFDFLHDTGRSHGWRGGLQEGNAFQRVHPELCSTSDEKP